MEACHILVQGCTLLGWCNFSRKHLLITDLDASLSETEEAFMLFSVA